MTIRNRVKLITILSLGAAIAVAAGVVFSEKVQRNAILAEGQMGTIRDCIVDLNTLTSDYLLFFGKRPERQWLLKNSCLHREMQVLQTGMSGDDYIMALLQKSQNKLTETFTKLRDAVEANESESGRTYFLKKELSAQLFLLSRTMLAQVNDLSNKYKATRNLSQKRARYLANSFFVALIAILISVLLWIKKAVLKPLSLLQSATEAISSGDYDSTVEIDTKDEFQSLAHSFNRMSSAIKDKIVDLNKEVQNRKSAEEEVALHRDNLEILVKQRTAELTETNEELQCEIAEREQVEKALHESEQRFRELFENMSSCVAVYEAKENGQDFVFQDFNRAAEQADNVNRHDLIGKSVFDVFPAVKEFGLFEVFQRVWETDKPEQYPISLYEDNRIAGWRDNYVYKLPSGEIVAIYTDETARKQAEEEKKILEAQLVRAQKMQAIGTLAGGIAHDFNNLLMGIQGYVSLMSFGVESTHPHHDMLKKIEKQVRSGATLTAQLLGYASKGQYDVKPVNLHEIVQETSKTFARTRKEITIHRELTEDLYYIEADQGQIEQIILNLYVNASDAMPDGGDLTIKTAIVTHQDMKDKPYDANPGNYDLLTVSDTGMGMDKDTQARIFEPFFTTKNMASSRGTGLGLASVYGIVKAHAGYIDVESEKGKGTTFSIYLPATEKRVEKEKAVEVAEQAIKGTGTVLLVDDEEVVLDVGTKLLEKLGYAVLDAESGRKALELYKDNRDKIDIVVLDMVMPDMGGGEAYDRMKEINPNVKVLLSSGYSIEDAGAKEMLNRGCDGFIQKPFGMKELSQSVREILEKD